MNQFAANVLIVVYQFTTSPELAVSAFILAVLAVLDIPLSVLREAYQHAADTRRDNADQPETERDWPTCVEMVLLDHDLITADECKLI